MVNKEAMTSVHCSDIQLSTTKGNADYTIETESPSTEKLGVRWCEVGRGGRHN